MEKSELNWKFIGIAIGGLILVLIVLLGVYQYRRVSTELAEIKSNPGKLQEIGVTEQRKILDEVGKLIELPANEEPTVATVTDADKLKDQPFFANARNGDKVIIYPNNKKAVLYRPQANKLIDVAPVSINISSQSARLNTSPAPQLTTSPPAGGLSPAADPSPTPIITRIFFLNGTGVSNLSRTVENELKGKYRYEAAGRDFAKKQDYGKTVVIANSLKKSAEAKKIADILKAEAGALPEGEETPTGADILILIGKDRSVTPTPSL